MDFQLSTLHLVETVLVAAAAGEAAVAFETLSAIVGFLVGSAACTAEMGWIDLGLGLVGRREKVGW